MFCVMVSCVVSYHSMQMRVNVTQAAGVVLQAARHSCVRIDSFSVEATFSRYSSGKKANCQFRD